MASFGEPMKIQSMLAGGQGLSDVTAQLTEQHKRLVEENAMLLNARLAEEHAMLARQNALLRMGSATPPPPGLCHPMEAPLSPGLGQPFPQAWDDSLPSRGAMTPPRSPMANSYGTAPSFTRPVATRSFGVPSAEEAAARALLSGGPGRFAGRGMSSRGGFSEVGRGAFVKRGPASEGATTPGTRSVSNSPGPSSRGGGWSAPSSGASSRASSPGVRSRGSSPGPSVPASDSPVPQTTLIVRKIPKSYTRDQLLALMDEQGFFAAYDLVYLPIDFATRTGLGYAFVNFTTEENASRFINHFHGFSDWSTPSKKSCEVSLSNELQGLEAHIDRYRSSPVMHESVPDEFKPAIFTSGVRSEFPAPTRPIKQPRLRASRQKLKTARRWGSEMDASQPGTPKPISEPSTPKFVPQSSFEDDVPDEF